MTKHIVIDRRCPVVEKLHDNGYLEPCVRPVVYLLGPEKYIQAYCERHGQMLIKQGYTLRGRVEG